MGGKRDEGIVTQPSTAGAQTKKGARGLPSSFHRIAPQAASLPRR